MKDLSKVPTVMLVNAISDATDQRIINIIAFELAKRIYVPGTSQSFEELLASFGWCKIEKEEENKLTHMM